MKYFFICFFFRDQILTVPRACNPKVLKSYVTWLRYSNFKHLHVGWVCAKKRFCVRSASDEMVSAFVQPALKLVLYMLSLFWRMVFRWVVISPYAEHAQKLVARWMSMRKNLYLVGWACAKIGYSLAKHTRKSFRSTTCIFWVPLFPV